MTKRSLHVGTGTLKSLQLEAESREFSGQVINGEFVGQIDVLANPGHRSAHQTSLPNAEEKRTSPSKRSRRSAMPWRNINVRSMPIPKANPV